jgi:hypothetical protein
MRLEYYGWRDFLHSIVRAFAAGGMPRSLPLESGHIVSTAIHGRFGLDAALTIQGFSRVDMTSRYAGVGSTLGLAAVADVTG